MGVRPTEPSTFGSTQCAAVRTQPWRKSAAPHACAWLLRSLRLQTYGNLPLEASIPPCRPSSSRVNATEISRSLPPFSRRRSQLTRSAGSRRPKLHAHKKMLREDRRFVFRTFAGSRCLRQEQQQACCQVQQRSRRAACLLRRPTKFEHLLRRGMVQDAKTVS